MHAVLGLLNETTGTRRRCSASRTEDARGTKAHEPGEATHAAPLSSSMVSTHVRHARTAAYVVAAPAATAASVRL